MAFGHKTSWILVLCVAAVVVVFCGACELAGTWPEKQEIAPAVLFVRQPDAGDPQGPPDGSEARPFPSLGAALAAAPDGALIRIGAGTYRESLILTRPVVLLGKGADRTRIVAVDPAGVAVQVREGNAQIYGLSIEGGSACITVRGGTHRLQRVQLIGCRDRGLLGRNADIELLSSSIFDVSGGRDGRGIDVEGGSLDARNVLLQFAGRRAVVLRHARGTLQDVAVQGSSLAALQVTDAAEARVVRGTYEGRAGAALYAGGSRLSVEGARVRRGEYAVLGYRGSAVDVVGGELTDYSVAAVALVNSHGRVEGVTIARGGTDAAISVTHADGNAPVLLADNRISSPGPLGFHITDSSVTARGNTVTGARLDAEKDFGDAIYAVDSQLVIERNVMRGNAGSGVATVRSRIRLADNGFVENGRAGILLLDRSRGTATGNTFARNVKAGVELFERSSARLEENRFAGNGPLDVDAGCGRGLAGVVDLGAGNVAAEGVLRQRICAQ